jgi:rubrerythrin
MFDFLKRRMKDPLLGNRENVEAVIMVGFEPAMQRVRDLERLERVEEARRLFDPLIGSVARGMKTRPDGFPVLLRALEEVRRRQRLDLIQPLLESLHANPEARTPEGEAVMQRVLAELQEAFSDSPAPADVVFYACQNCGGLVLHLTAPCPDCGFLPASVEDLVRGVLLSTQTIRPEQLAHIGGKLHTGLPFDRAVPRPETKLLEIRQQQDGARWQRLLAVCQRINVAEYRTVSGSAACSSCSSEFEMRWAVKRCPSCDSADVYLPPAREFKAVLRDCLLWIELVVRPDENHGLPLLLSELTRLKEEAAHNGRFVSQPEGYALKRTLERVGQVISLDGRYRLVFAPDGAHGNFVFNAQLQPSDLDNLYEAGPGLFNRLTEFLYQGVPLE